MVCFEANVPHDCCIVRLTWTQAMGRWMDVYVYVCMCMFMYVCMCLCLYVCVHVFM